MLGLYKPLVWEYARLNITNNLLSKRRLARLVADGHVSGWDDPRLLTLAGLRRRGVAPEVTLTIFACLVTSLGAGPRLSASVRLGMPAPAPLASLPLARDSMLPVRQVCQPASCACRCYSLLRTRMSSLAFRVL